MRYSVPRSLSPSPVRRDPRESKGRSTYGLNLVNYSDSDDSSDSLEDTDSTSDSEVEAPPEPPLSPSHKLRPKATPEQRHVAETIAAIRLRTRHHDPYEEWEKQTRKDAFRIARKDHAALQSKLLSERDKSHTQEERRLAAIHTRQLAEVEGMLSSLKIQQQKEEDTLKRTWEERDKALWARIDAGIKVEEDKVRVKLEAERKVREEAERKRLEEEARKNAEEERKRKEQEEIKRAADEKERLRVEQEKRQQEEERRRAQDEQATADGRKTIGLTTAGEDWRTARSILMTIKNNTMKPIKTDKARRSMWGEYRRKITPKIGQLTNDSNSIRDITMFIQSQIMLPNPPHPPMLYTGLCSSLAKAILLQAETEVTAEKKAALPLAQLTHALLENLPSFPEVFFAKLVQRCGPWAIPSVLPTTDVTGEPWKDDDERAKAMGYRRSVEDNVPREPVGEYMLRVAGIMRVYFAVLKLPPNNGQPLNPLFQMPRLWVWLARLMGSERMLESPVAAQLIYTALDVLGSFALQVWGHQWVKLLELVYAGATAGYSADNKLIGGSSAEGIAARSRLKMEVERIMAGR